MSHAGETPVIFRTKAERDFDSWTWINKFNTARFDFRALRRFFREKVAEVFAAEIDADPMGDNTSNRDVVRRMEAIVQENMEAFEKSRGNWWRKFCTDMGPDEDSPYLAANKPFLGG